jgi:hypothetical protein
MVRGKKTLSAPAPTEGPFGELSERAKQWSERLLDTSVCGNTSTMYGRYAEEVRELSGGIAAKHFLDFLGAECEKDPPAPGARARESERRAPITMRGYKCACLHVSLMEGHPWTSDQSTLVDSHLDGFEGMSDVRVQRGMLEIEQVKQVYDLGMSRGKTQTTAGLMLVAGACCRPRDVEQLTKADVSANCDVIHCEMKGPIHKKKRHGWVEPKFVVWESARDILRRRLSDPDLMSQPLSARVFPEFSLETASTLVKDCARLHNWDRKLLYDGAHCFRHASAADAFDEALEHARRRGNWAGIDGPIRYDVRGRPGVADALAVRGIE